MKQGVELWEEQGPRKVDLVHMGSPRSFSHKSLGTIQKKNKGGWMGYCGTESVGLSRKARIWANGLGSEKEWGR